MKTFSTGAELDDAEIVHAADHVDNLL